MTHLMNSIFSLDVKNHQMRIEYSSSEFKEGTTYRRVYLYEDNGDVIMTDGILYEDDLQEEYDEISALFEDDL